MWAEWAPIFKGIIVRCLLCCGGAVVLLITFWLSRVAELVGNTVKMASRTWLYMSFRVRIERVTVVCQRQIVLSVQVCCRFHIEGEGTDEGEGRSRRERDRQTDRQTERDRQTEADRQTDINRPTHDRRIDRPRERGRGGRGGELETESHTDNRTETDRQTVSQSVSLCYLVISCFIEQNI